MAVAIRLQRVGRKKRPFYRIVATDSKYACKGGNFLEILGTYNPLNKESETTFDEKKVEAWINKGAQVSLTVKSLFKKKKEIQENK